MSQHGDPVIFGSSKESAVTSSESSMLVYFTAAAAARPGSIPEFHAKALRVYQNPSPDFVEALDHVATLIGDTLKTLEKSEMDFLYRRKLCKRCRDVKVVSRSSPEYPLMAAKGAILTACDY